MKIPNKAIIKFEYNDELREYVFNINELNNIIKEKQARIEKAIKYLEDNTYDNNGECGYTPDYDIKELYNILVGEDK